MPRLILSRAGADRSGLFYRYTGRGGVYRVHVARLAFISCSRCKAGRGVVAVDGVLYGVLKRFKSVYIARTCSSTSLSTKANTAPF